MKTFNIEFFTSEEVTFINSINIKAKTKKKAIKKAQKLIDNHNMWTRCDDVEWGGYGANIEDSQELSIYMNNKPVITKLP